MYASYLVDFIEGDV